MGRPTPILVLALLLVGALGWSGPARAQNAPPVPPAPETAVEVDDDEGDDASAPGFEADEDADDDEETGRTARDDDDAEDEPPPISVPSQNKHDRLIEQILETSGEVSLSELIDEVMADVVAELAARPARWFSPMAIRQITLGSNINPAFARKLRSSITSHIHTGTEIRMVSCVECEATRTRIEGDHWVVTRGLVSTEELRRVGRSIGVNAFLDVAFGIEPEVGVIEIDFQVIRAKDARVLWADTFRADESTPMLLRASEAPVKRETRLRDLEMLLEGRPFYGYVASAGFMLIPYDDPVDGDIGGATAGYRIYERFGEERRVMFGLDLVGFLNTERLAGAVISAGSWWIPLRPDLINPELRLGAKAGAFIAGSEGNAAMFQLGAELLLRYRFGLYAYVLFMTKSPYSGGSGEYLGGVGLSTGISFNW